MFFERSPCTFFAVTVYYAVALIKEEQDILMRVYFVEAWPPLLAWNVVTSTQIVTSAPAGAQATLQIQVLQLRLQLQRLLPDVGRDYRHHCLKPGTKAMITELQWRIGRMS